MTAVLIAQEAPNSENWHRVRSQGIGASEISAVVGLNPWTSAFQLWHQKAGNLPTQVESEPTRWGHILEPIVADEFARRHPDFVLADAGTYGNDAHPWQLANCDRLVFDCAVAPYPRTIPDAVLEIKTSRFGDGFGPSGTDAVPLHVNCQVQQQMDVMGVGHAWVAVLIGGNDYREYVIGADPEAQQHLRDAGAKFWQSVQDDLEPPIDTSDATYQAVRALHEDIERGVDAEIPASLWDSLIRCAEQDEYAAGLHRQAKALVLDEMGTAQFATVAGHRVARRQAKGNSTPYLVTLKEKL